MEFGQKNYAQQCSGPEKLKKSRPKKLMKSNKSISWIFFWPNSIFCDFKNGQKSIFELEKSLKLPNCIFQKKSLWFTWFHDFFCLDFFSFSGPLPVILGKEISWCGLSSNSYEIILLWLGAKVDFKKSFLLCATTVDFHALRPLFLCRHGMDIVWSKNLKVMRVYINFRLRHTRIHQLWKCPWTI